MGWKTHPFSLRTSVLLLLVVFAVQTHCTTKYLIDLPGDFIEKLHKNVDPKAELWHPSLQIRKVHQPLSKGINHPLLHENKFSSFVQTNSRSFAAGNDMQFLSSTGNVVSPGVDGDKMACQCRFVKDPAAPSFIQMKQSSDSAIAQNDKILSDIQSDRIQNLAEVSRPMNSIPSGNQYANNDRVNTNYDMPNRNTLSNGNNIIEVERRNNDYNGYQSNDRYQGNQGRQETLAEKSQIDDTKDFKEFVKAYKAYKALGGNQGGMALQSNQQDRKMNYQNYEKQPMYQSNYPQRPQYGEVLLDQSNYGNNGGSYQANYDKFDNYGSNNMQMPVRQMESERTFLPEMRPSSYGNDGYRQQQYNDNVGYQAQAQAPSNYARGNIRGGQQYQY